MMKIMQDYRHGSSKISIGVPVFNGERYLRAARNSILKHPFRDFEVLISDNCSTGSTATLYTEYAAHALPKKEV